MADISSYIKYFRKLAAEHKEIFHDHPPPTKLMISTTSWSFSVILGQSSLARMQKLCSTTIFSGHNFLVAILYRPKKIFWLIRKYFTDHQDPRQRFRNRSLRQRAGNIAMVDHCVKYSVFLFFTGVLNSLPVLYPYVYQQKDETDNPDNGWASLIISLADGKTDDKSLETVMNSNLYNVFIGLNKKAKEYYEYLDKIDSNGRH